MVGLPVQNSAKLDSVPSRGNRSALTQRCPGQLCKFSKAEQNWIRRPKGIELSKQIVAKQSGGIDPKNTETKVHPGPHSIARASRAPPEWGEGIRLPPYSGANWGLCCPPSHHPLHVLPHSTSVSLHKSAFLGPSVTHMYTHVHHCHFNKVRQVEIKRKKEKGKGSWDLNFPAWQVGRIFF